MYPILHIVNTMYLYISINDNVYIDIFKYNTYVVYSKELVFASS